MKKELKKIFNKITDIEYRIAIKDAKSAAVFAYVMTINIILYTLVFSREITYELICRTSTACFALAFIVISFCYIFEILAKTGPRTIYVITRDKRDGTYYLYEKKENEYVYKKSRKKDPCFYECY